jgi:hypothetical protein
MHDVPLSCTRRFGSSPYSHLHANGCLLTDKHSAFYFRTNDGNWDQICDLLILKLLRWLPEHLIDRDGMQEKLHPNGVSRTNLSA